uniref:Uncharacterized protein n=1 Tax=Loxodonta africana TaxID=9785 RepID=G3U4T5_LOXAF
MHWTPEHAQPLNQWPEQHLDVSSTTPSPAHKLELPPGGRQRCHYAWAHDDISALTASNLLNWLSCSLATILLSPRYLNGSRPPPPCLFLCICLVFSHHCFVPVYTTPMLALFLLCSSFPPPSICHPLCF